jgi:GT2 family glycosyltransferase
MEEPKISIVIPTYRRENDFKKLINSIKSSDIDKKKYEVVIVSSDDKNCEKIKWARENKEINIKILMESDRTTVRNKSLYYYENLGIKASQHPWILICNDDMWFEKDWYQNFLTYFKKENKVYLVSSHIGDKASGLRIPSIGTIEINKKQQPMWLYDMSIININIYKKINYLDENIKWFGKGADLSLKVAFLTEETPILCHSVKINHEISSESRIENKVFSENDFGYIRQKWNDFTQKNEGKFYNWI